MLLVESFCFFLVAFLASAEATKLSALLNTRFINRQQQFQSHGENLTELFSSANYSVASRLARDNVVLVLDDSGSIGANNFLVVSPLYVAFYRTGWRRNVYQKVLCFILKECIGYAL